MTAEVIPLERPRRRPDRCVAATASGRPCRNRALRSGFCRVHERPRPPERIGPLAAEQVREALDLVARRLTGQYEVDVFGFDRELTERVLLPVVRAVYRTWWRTEWIGLEHVPAEGAGLLVSIHAGALPLDALVVKFGVLAEHPARRHVWLLAADLAFRLPVVAPVARRIGTTLACEEDARRLLRSGELVGVFPEGYKGVGKGWRNRSRQQRFGRGGFVELALRERVPIVPVAVTGAEEAYPMIANVRPLARMLGLPYFPVTPFFPWLGPLGLIPLPSKWVVEFLPPIPTDDFPSDACEDAMLRFELNDRIRDTIQQALHRNLVRRRAPFARGPDGEEAPRAAPRPGGAPPARGGGRPD